MPLKPGSSYDIMVALQRLLIEQLATDWPLTQNLLNGQDIVSLLSTSRYREGDEVLVKIDAQNLAYMTTIVKVFPWDPVAGYRVQIDPPVNSDWLLINGPTMIKAINFQPLKRVYLGDLRQIPDFPAISIKPDNEDNEWWTLRATSHEFNFTLRCYVMGDNFEDGTQKVIRFTEYVREILLDHIHPPVDYFTLPLTSDLPAGSTIVQVSSTSKILQGDRVYLRDGEKRPAGSEEAVVYSILGPNEVRLSEATEWDFLMARQAEMIVSRRYLYDTRPSRISYGYVPGQNGSFLHAAEISYFAKEAVCRTGNLVT